ncbi:MAG: Fe(2+)-trafficking protein [Acidobacteriota bacterium]|nr:Fe(2+)-trafficking protein [Acidobacteriota bacterium]
MDTEFRCCRCNRASGKLETAPRPGDTGNEIRERVCRACWGEWEKMEVMVINELRLDFMNPRAPQILNQHMRQFLMLDDTDAPT